MQKVLKSLLLGSFLLILVGSFTASAQRVALKTNLLHWATLTPNAGVEFKFANKWTMDISGGYNPFTFSENRKFKHWVVMPEFRLWPCEAFSGHFFGLHLMGGQYNVGGLDIPVGRLKAFKEHRFQGWALGAGLTYGYQFVLGKRLNLEASISAGYGYIDYTKYKCPKCGEKVGEGNYHYLGVTKATLSLIYFIN